VGIMPYKTRVLIAVGACMMLSMQPRAAYADTLSTYRINPGDELEVFVWGEDRLSRTVKILPDGSFSFPLVGRINALGRSPSELEEAVAKGLAPQFRGQVPQVTVSVKAPLGLQFSVIGRVKTPGSYAPGKYINVLEAISLAGGATEFADVANVVILRKTDGGLSTIRVKLTNTLKGNPSARDLSPNGLPTLVGGDTVVVP
jgi:polysaccharide export outer membrane protein